MEVNQLNIIAGKLSCTIEEWVDIKMPVDEKGKQAGAEPCLAQDKLVRFELQIYLGQP